VEVSLRPLAIRVVSVRVTEYRGHLLGLFGDGSPLSG
jgi:hypothetical protein